MDMHDASLGDSQRKTPAVPPKTGRHAGQQGRFRRVRFAYLLLSLKPGARWGSAGISFFVGRASIVLHWQSRSRLEQGESVESRGTKRHLPIKRRDTNAG